MYTSEVEHERISNMKLYFKHNWQQKYIYLDNATDVTPYCKCSICGKEIAGWIDKVIKLGLDKEECFKEQ